MFSHSMSLAVFGQFLVPFGSGSLTFDWPVVPEITNALTVTKNLLNAGHFIQQRMLFLTYHFSQGFDLDMDSYFRQLPLTVTVSVMSWEKLFNSETLNSLEYQFEFQLIVLIMYPDLDMLPKLDGYLLNLMGLRSSCKVIAIVPDFSEQSDLVIEKVAISFLRKHSIVFLFPTYAVMHEYGADHLEFIADKLDQTKPIFNPRKKFDGRVIRVAHVDDPPRSKVIDGRVTGLDGLFLDGYAKFMNTNYAVEKHFKQHNFLYELQYLTSFQDVLMFNIFDFVHPISQFSNMFYMFGPTHQCLLVPKQPPISVMEQFLKILQPSLIILLLMIFTVFGLILYLVLRTRPELRLGLFGIYFTLFQIAITNSVDLRKMRTLFERVSLLACIVVCFLIVSGVQSLLQQFLMFPITEDIDNVEHLIQSNLTIIVSSFGNISLVESFGAMFANNVFSVHYPVMEKINRSFAYMLNKEDVDRFYYSNENFVDGVQQMHKMKECLAKHYRGYISPMDGYYMESMHFYLQAIEEGGIRKHWEQQQDNFKHRIVHEEGAIRFVHIRKMFNLLFIGYTAGTLAFLVELIVGRVKQWRSTAE